MSVQKTFIRRQFRNFSVYISATAVNGLHDVQYATGIGEFTLQMTHDEISWMPELYGQAGLLIEAQHEAQQEVAA